MTTKADEDELLRSVALQNASSILIARQRAERRNEAYLAEAQRLSHTGSFGWSPATGEILWSEETFQIFQYDRTTKPTVDLVLQRVHPEDLALVKQTIERAAQDGADFDFEYRLLMPDGFVKHVHVVAHALSDESGGIEFVGAVMDVTQQYQSRAALEKAFGEIKKSQDRLRLVIDTMPGMVWSALPNGSWDFLSQRWTDYHGLSLEEFKRQGWEVVVHPDDVSELREKGLAAMAAGKPFELEFRSRRADGEYRWFLSRTVPLHDELGNIVKWYGTNTDIEDRKLAEILLAREKRLLEMIARGEPLGIILDALCRLVEELASGSLSSILLLDLNTNRLRHGAAPSLPTKYAEAIDGAVIGPSVGSCGTAAYRKQPVIVSDIATDPLWADFRELALAHGLRACWSTPILSSAGSVLGTFAIYYLDPRSPTPQDSTLIEQITHLASIAIERAQATQALLQQANLLEQAHDAILIWEFPSTIVYWNRGAEHLYGFPRTEAIGRPSHELLRTEHPMSTAEFEAALERDGEWTGELTHTTRDGRKIIVESRHVLVREKDGRRLVLETNRDITDRKRAETELRESEEQWRDVFENNPTMYFMVDAAGNVLSVNPFGAEQLGYTINELVGQPVLSVFPESEREAVQRSVSSCFEQIGLARSWEARKVRKDGTVIRVRETAKAVPRRSGPIILIACEDISEQKRAAEALRQAEADLAHVSRATTMGELTASLAHEVNQPITAAVTNANTCVRWLAGDTPNIQEARDAAMRSARDGTRAAEIISRIRLLFKKGITERELVDVNEVIREMIVLLRSEATRYSVSIRTDLATDLPQLTADRVQLQQVILNLIMNSLDAMKDIDGTREIVIKSQRAQNEQLQVSISDTGVGLPAQRADEIFNAFFTTKLQGTGLGLSISRSIVESHGGRLWAADNSPRGATFHIALPTRVEAD